MNKAEKEQLLHPLWSRIIEVLNRGECNTTDIQAALPEIPQASLYRHLKRMKQRGLLQISRQEAIRGVLKRSYKLNPDVLFIQKELFLSREEEQEIKQAWERLLALYSRPSDKKDPSRQSCQLTLAFMPFEPSDTEENERE